MKTALRVLLISSLVVLGLSILLFLFTSGGGYYRANDFLIILGLICLGAGALAVFVSLILFLTGPAQYDVAKGFLMSGGIFLLAGFAACSSATISFH